MHALDDKIPPPDERNLRTMACWMPLWVSNAVANLTNGSCTHRGMHSLRELQGKYAGRPAVVFGRGPSLDDALDHGATDLFKSGVGDPVLFCANSCTRPILARGIEPDYWTCMHPTADVIRCWNLAMDGADSIRMPTKGRNLISCPTVHPDVLKLWLNIGDDEDDGGGAGKVYMTLQGYAQERKVAVKLDRDTHEATIANENTHDMPGDWYGMVQHALFNPDEPSSGLPELPWRGRDTALPELPNMGCVANYGIIVAGILGCSPILLLGVDYAFTTDPYGHMRWAADDWRLDDGEWVRIKRDKLSERMQILSSHVHEATDTKGKKVLAHEPMIAYRNSAHYIYDGIKALDGGRMDIVNCSLGGIVTKTPQANLAEALWRCETGQWKKRIA